VPVIGRAAENYCITGPSTPWWIIIGGILFVGLLMYGIFRLSDGRKKE